MQSIDLSTSINRTRIGPLDTVQTGFYASRSLIEKLRLFPFTVTDICDLTDNRNGYICAIEISKEVRGRFF